MLLYACMKTVNDAGVHRDRAAIDLVHKPTGNKPTVRLLGLVLWPSTGLENMVSH